MGISRNSYDTTKKYQKINFQAGMAVADSDLNELQDIVRNNLKNSIYALYGNTAIKGTTYYGFEIIESAVDTTNNILIKAGEFIIGGQYLNLASDMEYTGQTESFTSLTTPSGADRTDTIYLDIWESEYGIGDDSELAFYSDSASVELSKRQKLHWVVNVITGTTSAPSDTSTHTYAKLCEVARVDGNDNITTAMITSKLWELDAPIAPANLALTTGFMDDYFYNSVENIHAHAPLDSRLSFIDVNFDDATDASGIYGYEVILYALDNSGDPNYNTMQFKTVTTDFDNVTDNSKSAPLSRTQFINLTAGVRYGVKARAIDNANPRNTGPFGTSAVTIAGIGTAATTDQLAAPASVTTGITATGLRLEWDAVGNAVGYSLYGKIGAAPGTAVTYLIQSSPSLSGFIPAEPGDTVYYAIQAYDKAGRQSSTSLTGSKLITRFSNFLYVGSNGCDYTTIGAALTAADVDNAADNQYVIYIMPGDYNETFIMRPYVHLYGADKNSVIIHNELTPVGTATAGTYTIANLTVYADSSHPTLNIDIGTVNIDNCTVYATSGVSEVIDIDGASNVNIRDSYIYISTVSGTTCISYNPDSSDDVLTIKNTKVSIITTSGHGITVTEGVCNIMNSEVYGDEYGLYFTTGATEICAIGSSFYSDEDAAVYIDGDADNKLNLYSCFLKTSKGSYIVNGSSTTDTTVTMLNCAGNADVNVTINPPTIMGTTASGNYFTANATWEF